MRVAVLQRVCPAYRVPLFAGLGAREEVSALRVFIGEDLPASKVRSAEDLSSLDVRRLPATFVRAGSRTIPLHRGLFRELRRFRPDVILAEAESHPAAFLVAALFRRQQAGTALVHWSLGALPGAPPSRVRQAAKGFLYRRADAFATYSSFGRDALVGLGCAPEDVIVALNVSDTRAHGRAARELRMTASQARAHLGLPERFTALFIGTFAESKRIDVLIDVAARMPEASFVLLGRGPLLEPLRDACEARSLRNVHLPGHVTSELPTYFRASDALVLPGRGGMVVSEAMAHGVPPIVFEADGTERDLVTDGRTGLRLARGDAADFEWALRRLSDDAELARRLGVCAQHRATSSFTLESSIDGLVRALERGRRNRLGARPRSVGRT